MPDKVYRGDVGTELVGDLHTDLTGLTSAEFRVKKPSGSLVVWTAEVLGETTIQYVTQVGDLDEAGLYLIQAKVVLPAWEGLSQAVGLVVRDRYEI